MTISHPLRLALPLFVCLGLGAAAQEGQKSAPSITIKSMVSEIRVSADGGSVQTLHMELHASNDAGALQISQTSIPYDFTAQEVTVVEAHTLKADGKSVPVDATAIYDQTPPGRNAAMVTGLRSKLIIFPQFTASDTAVYTIKVATKTPSFPGQFFHGEVFPRTVAYGDVRESLIAPKSFPLYVESHDVQASRREDGADVIYGWHYSAPVPVRDEQQTLLPLAHTPRFFVSSFKDYPEMGRAYVALNAPKQVVTPKVRALAEEITAGATDPRSQTQRLYEWVSSHIRYVSIELGTGSFIAHDVDSIISNGYGDCKDHDLLLRTLLKAKGIEAQSILLNGDASYELTDVPTFTTLNHVITFVPQLNLYLDSSAAVAPFGVLPLAEYGKSMVVASATSAALGKMPLLEPGIGKISVRTVAALDKNGVLTGSTTTTASGPYAISLREIGLGIQVLGPAAATRLLETLGYSSPSGSFTHGSPIGFEPEYTVSGTFRAQGWEDNLSGKSSFYIPGGLRLFALSGDNVMGPFDPGKMKSDEPTICFSAEQDEELSLKAPAGYHFFGLPNDTKIETANLKFISHWSLAGDTITVHRNFTSHIDTIFCSGAVRTQAAAALKRISDSYQDVISFAKRTGDGTDKSSEAALPFFNSGTSHANAGDYELAVADFDKAIALKPDDFYALTSRGTAYSSLHQYARAIEDFDRAIKVNTDRDPQVYNMRGFARASLQQWAMAIADFSQAIAMKPADAEAYSRRGEAYLRSGQKQAAIADLEKVIALDPDGPFSYEAYYFLASALMDGQPRKALTDANKAVALQPNLFNPYRLRAQVNGYLNQYPAAIADYDKAVSLSPENVDLLDERGRLHFEAKNYQQAITDFDKVITQKPKSALALFYRGGAKNKLGLKKDGERDIAAAVKLDPSLGK